MHIPAAVVVAGAVEPAVGHLTSYVDDQGVAIPGAVVVTHPAVNLCFQVGTIHINNTVGTGKLVGNQSGVRRLEDLEWVGLVGCARYTRQEALGGRITCQPVTLVIVLDLTHTWFVRQHAALYYTQPGRHSQMSTRSQRNQRTMSRLMRLQIPVSRIHGLPDTA